MASTCETVLIFAQGELPIDYANRQGLVSKPRAHIGREPVVKALARDDCFSHRTQCSGCTPHAPRWGWDAISQKYCFIRWHSTHHCTRISEIRATLGSFFLVLRATCLWLQSADAFTVVGTASIAAAFVRLSSSFIDKSASVKNIGGFISEALLGVLFLLSWGWS